MLLFTAINTEVKMENKEELEKKLKMLLQYEEYFAKDTENT